MGEFGKEKKGKLFVGEGEGILTTYEAEKDGRPKSTHKYQ